MSADEVSLRSGGPRTKEGKEVTRWNATRHGISSPAPVVPALEKPEDWQEHREGILESLSPVGHLEFTLAERVALISWRLHRVTRYETEAIAVYQEKVEDDLAESRRFGSGPAHPETVRSNAKSAEKDHRLLKRFARMEGEKALSGFDADSVIWSATECADKVVEGEVDPEELLESVSVSGVPDYAVWKGYEGWTAALVRAVIDAVAQATDEEPKELLEVATSAARREAEQARIDVGQLERDLQNMRRERLLPADNSLQKVARYEAHLSRQLYQALHELEALQARRSGGSAPLARLDVQGIPER
jgi:hypothetical protein